MAEPVGMDLTDVRAAIEWQADHAAAAAAPCTARVVRAELAILDGDSATGRRMANWHGLVLADAMPLRIAGGLHWLCLSGEDRRLEPVYAGLLTDQSAIDAIVLDMVTKYDARLRRSERDEGCDIERTHADDPRVAALAGERQRAVALVVKRAFRHEAGARHHRQRLVEDAALGHGEGER